MKPLPEEPPRILIVKTSSMGDVVHALPAVTDLARRLPGARIDWLVEEAFAEIPRAHGAVSQVIPLALRRWRHQWLRASTWAQVRALRLRLRQARYDRVLDLQGLLKSAWVARWARAPVAGLDARSAREPLASWFYDVRTGVDPALHAIERNRLLAALAFGYPVQGPAQFGVKLPPVPQAALSEWIPARPFALLLTNASRPTKLWPDEKWREVEAWLADQGLASVLVWGSERERSDCLRRASAMKLARVAPAAGLMTLAAISARARVVIGLDTGLTHWAAAVDAPTVGIFCDYDPARVGLRADALRVNLGNDGEPPSAEDVIDAARHVLAAAARRE